MSMDSFGYDIGDGPQALAVRGLSRAEWATIRDTYGADPEKCGPFLISAATGVTLDEAQYVWDEWPTYEAESLFEKCYLAADTGDVQAQIGAIRRSPSLRLELKVCASLGVPHSVFLSWPGADQDKAVANYIVSNSTCPGCGAPEEAMENPTLAEITGKRCYTCIEYKNARERVPDHLKDSYHVHVIPKSDSND